MDTSKKVDCKYWDKCYQKNEQHRQKYNHPPPESEKVGEPSSVDSDVEMKNNNTDVIKEPQKDHKAESSVDAPETKTETKTEIETEDPGTAKDKDDNSKKRKSSENLEENENHAKKINTHRLWQSPDEDYNELLKTNKFIHAKFLVKMPKDFYQFWDFAKTLGIAPNKNPFKKFNLDLVGPYDFLAGRFANVEQKNPGEYLRHWRFFYDPPEFQTIFVKKGTGVHYGYWRDDPKDEENLLIARNDAGKGCEFEFIGTNTFDALAYFLEKDFAPTPFTQADLSLVRKALNDFVSGRKIERSPLYLAKTNRWKTVASKTFHGAGIIVPVDKKSTIGYRPLMESDANLKKILSMLEEADDPEAAKEKVMEKLGPIITAAVIALDECDFGTNLELGLDLFSSGHPQLHATIQSLLVPAYTLLERPQLLAILKAHLDDRKKTFDLSILN